MNLRHRVVLIVASLVLVTAVVSSGLIVSRLRDQLIETTTRDLEHDLERRGQALVTHFDELVRDVRLVSGTPPITGIIRAGEHGGVDPLDGSELAIWKERLATIFVELVRSKPDYLQVRYIGAADDGRELVRVERSADGEIVRVPERALQRKGAEDYFGAGIAIAPERVHLTPITLNREHGQVQWPPVPVLRASRAIHTPGGELFGLIVINFDLRETFAELHLTDETQTLYLADEQGRYLSHPDPERAFEFERGVEGTIYTDFPNLGWKPIGPLETSPRFRLEGPVLLGAVDIAYGADANERVLRLLARRDVSKTLGVTYQVARQTVLVVGVLVALAIGLGIWLSELTTSPIRKLAAAVRELDIEGGGLDVPAGLPGEAGDLASALTRALELLRARAAQLEASNRELQQFVYIASHDLQEPVRTVSSFATHLRERYDARLDDSGRQCLAFLSQASERMRELIRGLLDYGRLGRDAAVESVDLARVVSEACGDLAASIEESGAEIRIGALPVVRGFPVELRLLFQNLIGNAVKFRHPERVARVEVGCEPEAHGWRLWVADNGVGIPPEQRDRVFRIYQRLHDDKSGTGIGLAHCRKIVELHGGRIWIEDEDGGGTRMCLHIEEPRA